MTNEIALLRGILVRLLGAAVSDGSSNSFIKPRARPNGETLEDIASSGKPRQCRAKPRGQSSALGPSGQKRSKERPPRGSGRSTDLDASSARPGKSSAVAWWFSRGLA